MECCDGIRHTVQNTIELCSAPKVGSDLLLRAQATFQKYFTRGAVQNWSKDREIVVMTAILSSIKDSVVLSIFGKLLNIAKAVLPSCWPT